MKFWITAPSLIVSYSITRTRHAQLPVPFPAGADSTLPSLRGFPPAWKRLSSA